MDVLAPRPRCRCTLGSPHHAHGVHRGWRCRRDPRRLSPGSTAGYARAGASSPGSPSASPSRKLQVRPAAVKRAAGSQGWLEILMAETSICMHLVDEALMRLDGAPRRLGGADERGHGRGCETEHAGECSHRVPVRPQVSGQDIPSGMRLSVAPAVERMPIERC
ncbi:hypothetical protein DENSPDRAFT_545240 [Dentipellis sp. KUC8613]|nr:hypothetical protein DENSPDRAFT_545240 [Dentipellis sp. KUC8613]